MKNHRLPVSIALLALAVLLLATALIATQIVLNHSALLPTAAPALVTLPPTCQHPYPLSKYGPAQQIRLKVDLFATMTAFVSSLAVLLVVVCFGSGCGDGQERESQETGLEGNPSRFHFVSRLDAVHLSTSRTTAIFLFSALTSIAAALPAGHYLQALLQSPTADCLFQFHEGELLAITVLSSAAEALALTAALLAACLHARSATRRRMEEEENGSESYRQQVDRIMREIPESERRVRAEKESEGEGVKQVESIIYKADPQLMLQSSHQPRSR